MFQPIKFTYEEVERLRSAFQMRQLTLSGSGDYPEEQTDHVIMGKILDWLYTAKEDINVATRGPRGKER